MERSRKQIAGRFVQMDSSAIRVRQNRCAKVRNRNVECLKCADACTSGCISVVDGELVVDVSRCVGCGTCATVCPTCALEARNPTDAELLHACLATKRDGCVVIACEQALRAAAPALCEGACASVVCLGRVDESLACDLVAAGVSRVILVCGTCSSCAQENGLSTARIVADTANSLLKTFGSDARVQVERSFPASCLAAGASEDSCRARMDAYFAHPCGASPVQTEQGDDCSGQKALAVHDGGWERLPRVMADGTLPHFIPDRRERLLDALAAIGDPRPGNVECRLWGHVVIDGLRCSSCRMCATFCPTGAISKFDEPDGTFGVIHGPADCVKCGSCRDICPEGAISIFDDVSARALTQGERHRYVMKPRPVQLNDPHQILNMARQRMSGDVYER